MNRDGSVAYNVCGVGSGTKVDRGGRRVLKKLGKERSVKRVGRSFGNATKLANAGGRHAGKSPTVTIGVRHDLGSERNRVNLRGNKSAVMINKAFSKVARKIVGRSRTGFKIRRIRPKNTRRLIGVHGFS